jgi:hypothetical protein
LLPLSVAAYAALFQGSDVTLLHTCAKQPNVPPQIPLRLLALGADPNALSIVQRSNRVSESVPEQLNVLESAIYHRSAQTQLALFTCSRLQLVRRRAQVNWFVSGCYEGQELAGAWPTQRENQAAGEKHWWRDYLDAAFRYIFLVREHYVQLASGHATMCIPSSSEQATTREWANNASGHSSLLAFVEEWLGILHPNVLMLVHLLLTEGAGAAADYAHGRRAAQPLLRNYKLARAILEFVMVSQNQ